MQRAKIQQMVNIAELYYLHDMKQNDIAKKLGLARSTISTLLTQAKEMGIVRIDVCDPYRLDGKYSIKFKETFGVDKCYTVHTSLKESEDVTDLIASRAGKIFDEHLKDDITIGIAWEQGVINSSVIIRIIRSTVISRSCRCWEELTCPVICILRMK